MPSKVARLSAIHTDIYNCTKCPLHQGRTRTVPGAGDPDAEILFIGEAPGFNEDKQGLPFVGRSGNYLEELLASIKLTRNDVFIANVVKCRPPENRNPHLDEIETCNPYIMAQIEVLDPLIIITLGKFGMSMFFPNTTITRIHGQPKFESGRVYYPLFHPAYVLRDDTKRPEMQADFERIPQLLLDVRQKRESSELVEDEIIEDIVLSDDVPPDDDDTPKQKGLFD